MFFLFEFTVVPIKAKLNTNCSSSPVGMLNALAISSFFIPSSLNARNILLRT
jgi:hypothetical protein